jgi:hypothetical protein
MTRAKRETGGWGGYGTALYMALTVPCLHGPSNHYKANRVFIGDGPKNMNRKGGKPFWFGSGVNCVAGERSFRGEFYDSPYQSIKSYRTIDRWIYPTLGAKTNTRRRWGTRTVER